MWSFKYLVLHNFKFLRNALRSQEWLLFVLQDGKARPEVSQWLWFLFRSTRNCKKCKRSLTSLLVWVFHSMHTRSETHTHTHTHAYTYPYHLEWVWWLSSSIGETVTCKNRKDRISIHVITLAAAICKHFRIGRQEDSHEFLRYAIDHMHEASLPRNKRLNKSHQYASVIHKIFGGCFKNIVTCATCRYVSLYILFCRVYSSYALVFGNALLTVDTTYVAVASNPPGQIPFWTSV